MNLNKSTYKFKVYFNLKNHFYKIDRREAAVYMKQAAPRSPSEAAERSTDLNIKVYFYINIL